MKIPVQLSKKYYIEPYNTFKEKELLLLSSFEVDDIGTVFDILGFEHSDELSEDEQRVLLYKYREISLGDEIQVKFKCDNCKKANETSITANNFIVLPKRNDKFVKKIAKEVTDDNLQEFVDIGMDVDDLDVSDFEELKQKVKDNQLQFNFIKECSCIHCGTKKRYDLSSIKYIIEIMSDDTLMTLYKTYNAMIFFGHYSKEDIDKMYPFERSIFIGLLNKTKEDLNK